MIFEYISLVLGTVKLFIYKILNFGRIKWSGIPKLNRSFHAAIQKGSLLKLGKGFRSRNNVSFRIYNEGVVEFGDNCFLNDGVSVNCQKKITFGDNVLCGQNVMFFDHDHDYKGDINSFVREETVIGSNVWIGANCVILKGAEIGDGAVIAAGTVVKGKIPSGHLVYQERTNIIKEYIKSE